MYRLISEMGKNQKERQTRNMDGQDRPRNQFEDFQHPCSGQPVHKIEGFLAPDVSFHPRLVHGSAGEPRTSPDLGVDCVEVLLVLRISPAVAPIFVEKQKMTEWMSGEERETIWNDMG